MARRRGPAEIVVKPRRTTPVTYRIDNHRWRVLKRKHKAHSKTHHLPCWLEPYGMCLLPGVPIDYTTGGTPASYETDHEKPRKTHPALMYVWANLRASHLRCNRSRQAKAVVVQQDWVRPKF